MLIIRSLYQQSIVNIQALIRIFNITQIDSKICLEISDNGIGVPNEHLKDLFDPFFTLKKIRKGTGLGLAVSYNIMEQHNGKINCKNIEEGGLLISLLFPTN